MLDMLCMIDAPTSCEKSILKFIQTRLSCDFEYDAIGNLVAHKKGEGKKLMFYTSVDEDAFVVMTKDKRNVQFSHKGEKTLKKGDVLCIIEAMKLMNEIESEYDGKIAEVFIKDGEPVDYGKPLFRIV